MNLGLKDKTALVCASTSGLGLATARALAAEGARVIISGRSQARASEAAATIPNAIGIGCDLVAEGAAEDLHAAAVTALGSIDILVLNGPGPAPGTAAGTTGDGIKEAIATLVLPQQKLVQLTLPAMRENKWSRVLTTPRTWTSCAPHLRIRSAALEHDRVPVPRMHRSQLGTVELRIRDPHSELRTRVRNAAGNRNPAALAATAAYPLIIHIDATLVTWHSDKENVSGEILTWMLRPGNAGANSAATQLPDGFHDGRGYWPRRQSWSELTVPGPRGSSAGKCTASACSSPQLHPAFSNQA